MENPPHPGEFLQTEVIAPNGLSVTEAAAVLGITRGTLSTFLNMRSTLSTGMALRIEKAFGIRMDSLMRMQNCFDIAEARKRAGEITIPRYTAAKTT
ncbi:HigA family addiction module antitoxin [Bauldia litoralis]|uniref:HigA family addiction module antitoxin n=1 Tax=Bauldia litoralis TaxID=665467 RepID=UPI00326644FB